MTFFASIFTGKRFSHTTQVTKGKWRDWENKEPLPKVGEDQVQGHLGSLKVHRSMGPDEMHLRLLSKPAEDVAKPQSIVFEKSQQPGDVGKGRTSLFVKRKVRKTGQLQTQQSHFSAQQDHGAEAPGNHAKTRRK